MTTAEYAGEAIEPVNTLDFSDFKRWYTQRRRRTTGKAPSKYTLRYKDVYLRKAARESGCHSEADVANLLTDPIGTGRLLETWEENMTPGGARVAVYTLLSFVDYAVDRGMITSVTDACVTRDDLPQKNPRPPITCYSQAEMETFVSAAKGTDPRFWALLAYLVDTGRRIGETLDIEFDHLRLLADVPHVELPATKSGEPQYVPLSKRLRTSVFVPETLEWFRAHPVKGGRMGGHRDHHRYLFPWSYNAVKGRFSRFCERTGLPDRGFHNFRHTVITDRLTRGVPIHAVAKLAGHSSPTVTAARYDHTDALHFHAYVEREE